MMMLLLACAVGKEAVLYTVEELQAEIEGYEDWAQPAGWGGAVPSCDGTHGPYVEIWYNAVTLQALSAGEPTMPEGAILVKQAYSEKKKKKTSMTTMRKVAGFAPDEGDWFWGTFDADGTALNSGAISGCTGCHAASDQDFLMFPDSPVVVDPADCP